MCRQQRWYPQQLQSQTSNCRFARQDRTACASAVYMQERTSVCGYIADQLHRYAAEAYRSVGRLISWSCRSSRCSRTETTDLAARSLDLQSLGRQLQSIMCFILERHLPARCCCVAFGIMMWELYTGQQAFRRLHYGQFFDIVVSTNRTCLLAMKPHHA